MFWKKSPQREVEEGLQALFPRLWRYCLLLTTLTDRADDLAQSTCVRALEKSNQFTSGTSLDRWVFRIAKTIWFNELRAEVARQGGALSPKESAERSDHRDPLALVDDYQSKSDLIGMNKDVLKGLLALPEAQRITVALVYIEGYSYKEAADILEIPVGTIMSRLATARVKLAERFTDYRPTGYQDNVI